MYQGYFPLGETIFFQKISCHSVALLGVTHCLTIHTSLRLSDCMHPLPARGDCMYHYPLNVSLFSIWIEQTVLNHLETKKTLCGSCIALWNRCSMMRNIPSILYHIYCSSFPFGSSYLINNLLPLTMLKRSIYGLYNKSVPFWRFIFFQRQTKNKTSDFIS